MQLTEEQLAQKISVPNSLSLAEPELKSKLVGKAPVQKYMDILDSLDPESEIYETLQEEVMSAVGYEEPQEEPEEDSGVVVLPISSIKKLKNDIIAKMESTDETIKNISFPEFPEFPEFPKYPTSIKVGNLSDIKMPVYPTEMSVSNLSDIIIPDTINLNKPDWWNPVDFTSTNNIVKLVGNDLQSALSTLNDDMHDPTNPVKVQIVDKKGNVIDKFASVSSGGSSGGGGGSTAGQPRNLRSGSTAVTTAATAVQLDPDNTFALRVDVQAPSTNTGTIYVGNSDVSAVVGSEKGIGLQPGDVYAFDMMSLDIIYLDSTVNGEGVTWNIFA